eukprot:COSAG01_NODE_4036_length_5414_cov_56.799812_5_plen_56_part_00
MQQAYVRRHNLGRIVKRSGKSASANAPRIGFKFRVIYEATAWPLLSCGTYACATL